MVIMFVLAFGLFLVVGALPAKADPVLLQPGELVVNGGGEDLVTVGWTAGLGRQMHGVGGYPQSVIVDENGLTGETYPGGAYLLVGVGASSEATQTIDLTPSAAAIDNGNVDALLSAYIGGYTNQLDQAQVTYTFFDGDGIEVDSVVFGPVLPVHRGNVPGFVPFADTVRLQVGTRSAVVTISTVTYVGVPDGYIDNVSLILDAPSPAASPDTASTAQGVPVEIEPALNDTPGAGAEMVPSSVRLLDGGTEVLSLTNEDGNYTVDGDTGAVLFTPAPGFYGTTSSVPYRITDTSFQQAESTITVDVALASPGLSLEKSGTLSGADDSAFSTEVDYSFLVTNTGNVPVNSVAIVEESFSGSGAVPEASCPSESLLPDESTTCTAVYQLTQADVDTGTVANTATAIATYEDDSVSSSTSTAVVSIAPAPAFTFSKTSASEVITAAGEDIAYQFRVENTGNVTLTDVAIHDMDFSGAGELGEISCPTSSLAPNEVLDCVANYTVVEEDLLFGSLSNSATAIVNAAGDTLESAVSSVSISIEAVELEAVSEDGDDTLLGALPMTGGGASWLAVGGALGAVALGIALLFVSQRRARASDLP